MMAAAADSSSSTPIKTEFQSWGGAAPRLEAAVLLVAMATGEGKEAAHRLETHPRVGKLLEAKAREHHLAAVKGLDVVSLTLGEEGWIKAGETAWVVGADGLQRRVTVQRVEFGVAYCDDKTTHLLRALFVPSSRVDSIIESLSGKLTD
jgi:hypothetical protein